MTALRGAAEPGVAPLSPRRLAAPLLLAFWGLSAGLVQAQTPPASTFNAIPAPGDDGSVTLSLDQSRALARGALRQGNAALAHRLASALLTRDPGDTEARLVLAASAARLGDPALAYDQAGRAFAQAQRDELRYEAANIAAEAAFLQGRKTLAQLWLRRAAQSAPDQTRKARTAQDYRAVRAQNPWRAQLDLSVAPSSNINNGASTDRLIVNGQSTQATLSGDAQALSGLESRAVARLSYRLRGAPRSVTEFGLRVESRSYALSDSAKALAPAARGSDFAYGSVELLFNRHLRPVQSSGPLSFGATLGQSFYAGRDLGRYVQLRAGRGAQLAPAVQGAASALVERQWRARNDGGDTTSVALTGQLQRQFGGNSGGNSGGSLPGGFSGSLHATLLHVSGEIANARSTTLRVGARISPDRAIGPVRPSFSLSASLRDFPSYSLGLVSLPNGRQDTTVSADVDLLFPKLDVWGFAPTLTLTAARGRSNISRFETRQLGVSFGFQSLF